MKGIAGMKLAYEPYETISCYFQKENCQMDRERRRARRRPLELSVYCQKVGAMDGRLFSGNSVNVSPSGILLKMQGSSLRDGELVSVELAVPQSDGAGQAARFSSYARVVRVDDESAPGCEKEVALEFCESPRFQF